MPCFFTVAATAKEEDGNGSSSYEDLTTTEEESDSEEEEDEDRFSTASSSNCSQGGKGAKKKKPIFMTKSIHNKSRKLKRSQRCDEVPVGISGIMGGVGSATGGKFSNLVLAKPGDRVVVETLTTKSVVEVVWQDSTTEGNISSRQLFPIHHLDDQEFFCGDFVVRNQDEFNPHSYGVVQEVDHIGRTCKVRNVGESPTFDHEKAKKLRDFSTKMAIF